MKAPRASIERCRVAALACAATVLAAPSAWSQQILEVRDGIAVEAIVSLREPTRIRIEGTPIVDVFGNVYLNNCGAAVDAGAGPMPLAAPPAPQVNPGGEFILECDRDKGEIYVRPVGNSDKPVNIFVSSTAATYTLLLRRSDVPAGTIVLRDRSARRPAPPAGPGGQGPSPSHIRSLKTLLAAMTADRAPADVRVEEIGQPIQLWADTSFMLVRRHERRGLVGETYRLQNTGTAVIVLAEQEFDREDAQVMGISIEHHRLQPGQSTQVFVIRQENPR